MTLSDGRVGDVRIPMQGAAYGPITATDHRGRPVPVPDQKDVVGYLVLLQVAISAPERSDLLVAGPPVVEAHKRKGCRGLIIPHHPVAALSEPRVFSTKATLAGLRQWGPNDGTPEMLTPFELASAPFEAGLMSREEMDIAEAQFGPRWKRHAGD